MSTFKCVLEYTCTQGRSDLNQDVHKRSTFTVVSFLFIIVSSYRYSRQERTIARNNDNEQLKQ